ncbi:MAG: PAS domain-containing sensor histidine kinase [Bacteroidota bacterium]
MHINVTDNYVANQLFKVSADYAPVGIMELDALGYCRYVNYCWCELSGIDEHTIKDKGWQIALHPDDLDTVIMKWSDASEIQDEFNMEFRLLTPDGTINWVQCRADSLVNDDHETIGYIATIMDVTERIQLQQELLANNHTLSQFRYIISHDLRGPVRNIVALLKFFNKEDPNDVNNPNIIDKLEQSAKKLQSILQELIEVTDLTKPNADVMKEIRFDHVVNTVKNGIEDVIVESNAQIMTDFSKAPSIIYTGVHLQSILLNLISNAIKYKSPDRDPAITLQSYKQGQCIYLTVSDNGRGINMAKNKDRVFGLFQRFHDGLDGKGLGLYIIKSIIESHGGSIDVESEENVGTTFTICFKKQ